MFSRESLKDKIKYEVIHVDSWNEDARIKALSGYEITILADWVKSLPKEKQESEMTNYIWRAKIVAMSLVDEENNRIYQDHEYEELLPHYNAVHEIWLAIWKLSGFIDTDAEQTGEQSEEEPAKNSESKL